uniref:THUMP domain-containing protein n=2 Tax=Schizophyllum commune (strain H4-8 / FGSC 9210) TaxID=578458 RepID=D8QIH2_SCHCM
MKGARSGKNDRNREGQKKKKYRSDGTPIWTKPTIEGPGIWATCPRGKERQTVGELYDLFESLSAEIWPPAEGEVGETEGPSTESANADDSDSDEDLSIEAQIAKEVAGIKKPAAEKRIQNCHTDTQCVVFMACRPPVEPVVLVMRHLKNVEMTGITRTRQTHRLLPVSGSCTANIPEIQALCRDAWAKYMTGRVNATSKYKIELRIRNHSTLTRMAIIQAVAECVPEGFSVDLNDPEVFVLVEVFKSTCGIGVVEDYYRLHKFNVGEVAKMCKARGEGQASMTRLGEAGGAEAAAGKVVEALAENAAEAKAPAEKNAGVQEEKVAEAQTEKILEAPAVETQGKKPAEDFGTGSAVL